MPCFVPAQLLTCPPGEPGLLARVALAQVCASAPGAGGPRGLLPRRALGQEQGAAGWGARQGHSFQWQSWPGALMGPLCQLMQSFPVLNLVRVVMPDIPVW